MSPTYFKFHIYFDLDLLAQDGIKNTQELERKLGATHILGSAARPTNSRSSQMWQYLKREIKGFAVREQSPPPKLKLVTLRAKFICF